MEKVRRGDEEGEGLGGPRTQHAHFLFHGAAYVYTYSVRLLSPAVERYIYVRINDVVEKAAYRRVWMR